MNSSGGVSVTGAGSRRRTVTQEHVLKILDPITTPSTQELIQFLQLLSSSGFSYVTAQAEVRYSTRLQEGHHVA